MNAVHQLPVRPVAAVPKELWVAKECDRRGATTLAEVKRAISGALQQASLSIQSVQCAGNNQSEGKLYENKC